MVDKMNPTLKEKLFASEVIRMKSLGYGDEYIKNNINKNKILNQERERMRSLGYSIRYIDHLLT